MGVAVGVEDVEGEVGPWELCSSFISIDMSSHIV